MLAYHNLYKACRERGNRQVRWIVQRPNPFALPSLPLEE
jgi:hypothetical protein